MFNLLCCHFITVPKLTVLEKHKSGADEEAGKIKIYCFNQSKTHKVKRRIMEHDKRHRVRRKLHGKFPQYFESDAVIFSVLF